MEVFETPPTHELCRVDCYVLESEHLGCSQSQLASVSQPLGGRSSAPVLLAHRPRDGSWHASEATFASGAAMHPARAERATWVLVLQIEFLAPRRNVATDRNRSRERRCGVVFCASGL